MEFASTGMLWPVDLDVTFLPESGTGVARGLLAFADSIGFIASFVHLGPVDTGTAALEEWSDFELTVRMVHMV
jgi:hypothetical protein